MVELLLSKGARTEVANKVMNPNCWLKKREALYKLNFDDFRDKIITISVNIRMIRSAEMKLLWSFVDAFISVKVMKIEWDTIVPMTEDERMNVLWLSSEESVRPSARSCSFLRNCRHMLHHLIYLSSLYFIFDIGYILDFIYKYFLIIACECCNFFQNALFPEHFIYTQIAFSDISEKHYFPLVKNTGNYLSYQLTITSSAAL